MNKFGSLNKKSFFFVQNVDDFVVTLHLMLLTRHFFKQGGVFFKVVERLLLLLDFAVVVFDLLLHFSEFPVAFSLLENVVLVKKYYNCGKYQCRDDILVCKSFQDVLKSHIDKFFAKILLFLKKIIIFAK